MNFRRTQLLYVFAAVILTFVFYMVLNFLKQLSQTHSPTRPLGSGGNISQLSDSAQTYVQSPLHKQVEDKDASYEYSRREFFEIVKNHHKAQRKDIVAYTRKQHEMEERGGGFNESPEKRTQRHQKEMAKAKAERDDPDKLNKRLEGEWDEANKQWDNILSDLNKGTICGGK